MSTLAWLDTSPEDERRMREIVKMFSDTGTLDDLGIGQARDGLADLLFPGTSTIQARARYFLLVPWAFQKAAIKHTGTAIVGKANDFERETIEALREATHNKGMIGSQAGKNLRTLPSAVYWSALQRFGILLDARTLVWSMPIDPPAGFPRTIEQGLELKQDEAEWLKERIIVSVPTSYLAYLLTDGADTDPNDVVAPWDHPALDIAPEPIRDAVEHARLFSLAIHGASLIYNLLIAEKYDEIVPDGDSRVEDFTNKISGWAVEVNDNRQALAAWDRAAFWATVLQGRGGRPVSPGTKLFIDYWVDTVLEKDAANLVDDTSVRQAISERERLNKGTQARLQNKRQIQNWQGSSGAARLAYRWPNVRTLLADIREGLADASS
ncbi:DUF6361 family protein [Gordonia defluvii]|uniref:DUF6361 family protein n=1 Tax=Gordonia defluvii TaxID=283718 RepID=A0ABP6LL89_9ACTN